jgi:hypothetical protein
MRESVLCQASASSKKEEEKRELTNSAAPIASGFVNCETAAVLWEREKEGIRIEGVPLIWSSEAY